MSGSKYPFEYEVTPDDVIADASTPQRYLVRLRNVSNEVLTDLNVQIDLIDTKKSMDSTNQFLGNLAPNETKTLSFQTHAPAASKPYLSVFGQGRNYTFYWNSEQGEVSVVQKPSEKQKIKARIEKDEEAYRQRAEVFDKKTKKNEGDVEKWMTGEADE